MTRTTPYPLLKQKTFPARLHAEARVGVHHDGGDPHIALSAGKGATLGGHLRPGSSVLTTAEIVLVELDALSFSREKDNETTYDEMVVRPRPKH